VNASELLRRRRLRAATIAAGVVDLPDPRLSGGTSVEQAIAGRRSVRRFTRRTLNLRELSQLLWAAQGITSRSGARAAPSPGALYPLDVYVVTRDRLGHYIPHQHRLLVLVEGDLRSRLAAAVFGQAAVEEAPAVFVVTAVYARAAEEYGPRAERYATLEAGHVAQNILLQAVALGLAAVPVGAFDGALVRSALGLPADHEPLYLLPVGHAAGDGG
jgi:SagB-type dehydrogenase family enzyme